MIEKDKKGRIAYRNECRLHKEKKAERKKDCLLKKKQLKRENTEEEKKILFDIDEFDIDLFVQQVDNRY